VDVRGGDGVQARAQMTKNRSQGASARLTIYAMSQSTLPKPSSTAVGTDFELKTLDLLNREIDNNRLHFRRDRCQVFHKKGYYSEDRKDNIVFDIAIELWMPGAEQFTSLFLVECKNTARPVDVGELQTFFSSIEQIGGGRDKGIVVSSAGFTKQALDFAKSKGMGLVRHFPEDRMKWELYRSTVGSRWTDSDRVEIERGLLINEYEDANSAFYCFGPTGPVNTFNEMLAGLTKNSVDSDFVQAVTTTNTLIGFLSKESIDLEVKAVLDAIGYEGGAASLEQVEQHIGVRVLRGVAPGPAEVALNILGRISFQQTPTITLYEHANQQASRARFTLAHELGHHLLGHGRYMATEYCDTGDHDNGVDRRTARADIKRMEWQANRFASKGVLPTGGSGPCRQARPKGQGTRALVRGRPARQPPYLLPHHGGAEAAIQGLPCARSESTEGSGRAQRCPRWWASEARRCLSRHFKSASGGTSQPALSLEVRNVRHRHRVLRLGSAQRRTSDATLTMR
jgi:hypothetical protein